MANVPMSLCLLTLSLTTAALAVPDSRVSNSSTSINLQLQVLLSSLRQLYPQFSQGRPALWEMVGVAALCGLLPGIWWFRRVRTDGKTLVSSSVDTSESDGANVQSPRDAEEVNGKFTASHSRFIY